MILKFPKFSLKTNLNSLETSKKLNVLKEIRSKNNTWCDEVYFETFHFVIKLDEKTTNLIVFGDITYRCEGNSISIVFEPIPNFFSSFKTSTRLLNNLKAFNNEKHKLINIIM